MGGDVENLGLGVVEHRLEIVGDPRRGEECVPAGARALEAARADRDHVQAVARVRFELEAAGADKLAHWPRRGHPPVADPETASVCSDSN